MTCMACQIFQCLVQQDARPSCSPNFTRPYLARLSQGAVLLLDVSQVRCYSNAGPIHRQ